MQTASFENHRQDNIQIICAFECIILIYFDSFPKLYYYDSDQCLPEVDCWTGQEIGDAASGDVLPS